MRQITFVFILLAFSFSAFSQTPTIAASNVKFNFIGCNEVEIEWTNGNGSDRVVFMREGSAVSDVPEYNEYYTDNPVFSQPPSEDIKDDLTNFCVYRGPGNKVTVKGLKNLTKYCVAVFEYNGGGGIYDYKTDGPGTACVTTKNIFANFKLQDSTGYDTGAQCQYTNKFKFINKSNGDITPLSYSWDFNDGKFSTATDPTHVYTSPGIKQVKLTVTSKGCLTSVTINDTVHPHPVAKYDLDPLKPNNTSPQCFFGNRFTFLNDSRLLDIGAGPSSMRYEWYENNDTVIFSDGYKADRKFPAPGQKTVKLVVISNMGCRDSTYHTYEVLPRAIDPAKVSISPKAMCLNNNFFTFKNSSPNSINTSWRYRDSAITKDLDSAFTNPATYTFLKTGKFYITLRAYDNLGCLDQLTDSVNVFQNTNVKFDGLKDTYCVDDPASNLIPTPPTKDGNFTGTNLTNDSIFHPIGVGKFYITYTSSIGCKESFVDSTIVYPKPVVDLGKDTSICKDSPLQLSVNPPFKSVSWASTPLIVGVNGSSSSSVNINVAGKYSVSVTVTDDNNCVNKDQIEIRSLNTPTLKRSRDTTLCGGSYLVFNLKVDDGTIVWNDGNTNGNRNLYQTGIYKVYVSNKCGTVSDSFNLNVEETACKIFFPNAFTPNGDLLNDTWQPFGKYEFVRMNIYNRWGEQVYFSDKSPVWNGYTDKDLCLDGVYGCVFEYLIQDGNSMKKITEGLIIHLVR